MITYEKLSNNYLDLDITKLNIEQANKLGLEIKNIEISQEVYLKIKKYIVKYNFYSEQSRIRSGTSRRIIIWTSKFTLSEISTPNKESTFLIGNFTKTLPSPVRNYLTKKDITDFTNRILKDHPIILSTLEIFYGMLKKYPNDIYKVKFYIHDKPNQETQPLIRHGYSSGIGISTSNVSPLKENGPYKDLYDDISDTGEDVYLSDGIWITPEGELDDKGH